MTSALPAITLMTSTSLEDLPLIEVERIFWDCDFQSRQRMLAFEDACICSVMFERLKAEKFNGEFDRLLEWWRINKEREYAARAEASRERDEP